MTLSLLPDERQIPQWTDAPEDNRNASERLNEPGEKRRTVYWLKRPVD
jgi:hypothetical protein